ncbi:DUF2510 domain-containing protein [Hamadaea tsunoensis]|uniref:DUF2510 domain-containing protein n=1 Tax=Hamadaea tsunoensis TaxID=53368 RepID=UPI0003F5D2F1|nr:DUF2510 domain-containing protein [Hamadaea tsunoensis]
MFLSVLGVLLLAAGFAAALRLARARLGRPEADWFPDPSTTVSQSRFWDGRAWTGRVRASDERSDRGRFFHGRFWGRWIWFVVAALVVIAAGGAAYRANGEVALAALVSFLAMTALSWAFYRFMVRQLALDDVIGLPELIAVMVAVAGAVLVIAANVNSAILNGAGARTATITVGLVEEGTKLLVPLCLYAFGRYRDPRAGLALGLAAGFAFAITETTQYAYATAHATGPNFCGTQTAVPTTLGVLQAQVFRMFSVSPLHWLWTAAATALAWRMWHLYGRRGTPAAVGGIVLVMVVHSANDTSATFSCDEGAGALLLQLGRWILLVASYLFFKAMARKSTPPQLVGAVSRGWTPRHLPKAPTP